MSPKLKWLIVIQLLLTEQALCRLPFPLAAGNAGKSQKRIEGKADRESPPVLGPKAKSGPELSAEEMEDLIKSATRTVSNLTERLQGQVRDRLLVQVNVGCEELLSASSLDDLSPAVLPREVLALSLVPVLAVAGCPREAQTLVLKLYRLLGVGDTEELLVELEELMAKNTSHSISTTARTGGSDEEGRIDALMFNIQQLAAAGDHRQDGHCDRWARVSGAALVGPTAGTGTGDLREAATACEGLGTLCGGVTRGGATEPGQYRVVLKEGSRVLPSSSDCWIRQCHLEEEEEGEEEEGGAALPSATSVPVGRRTRRSPRGSCVHPSEQRVFRVLEWVPAVSTLYSLGTAVYYASVNCSATARERALLSAVDLGTDALIVATGGTVGVAGYALGAGVKTGVKAGVKYLLNSMKHEGDVLVNQFSSEDGVFTVE